jgi:hypothetical protein
MIEPPPASIIAVPTSCVSANSAREVGLHHGPKIVERHVGCGHARRDARVVDEHVDAAQLRERRVDQTGPIVGRCHVAGNRERARDTRCDVVQLRGAARRHDHACARGGNDRRPSGTEAR